MKRLLLLLLFFPLLLNGQKSMDEIKKNVFSNPFSVANQNYIRMMEGNNTSANENIFFLLEDWGKMVVKGHEDLKLVVDSANYVIPDDQVYFIQKNQLYKLHPTQVEQLAIDYRLFGCYQYINEYKKEKTGYFEVLNEGKLNLLKKYQIKERKVFNNPMGVGNNPIEKYQDSELYYFNEREKLAIPVPKKKGQIISLFTGKRSKVIEFARKRDLSLNSEEDVKLLFAYYNMLYDVQEKKEQNNQ